MKLIISTITGLIVFAVVWYYIPEPTKDKVVNFTGKAVQSDPKELPTLAKEEFLPNPEEKREILIGELKKNLENIKTGTDLPKSIAESEKLLEELKTLNQEKPISASVFNRALDLILPAKNEQCPAQ